MLIGHDENYLKIEPLNEGIEGRLPEAGDDKLNDPFIGCRIEAVSDDGRHRFNSTHELVLLHTSDQLFRAFAEFEELRESGIMFDLSFRGWIRLKRNVRGGITLSYRLGERDGPAAMEGEVFIDGEFACQFCNEFKALLWSR